MAFYVNCSESLRNTGLSRLCADFGTPAGYILTPKDFTISEEDAKLKTAMDTEISKDKDLRVYPFPAITGMTDNSEDTVFEEMALGNIFIRDGKYNLQFMHESSRYKNAALRTHSLQDHGFVMFDTQGRLQGIQTSDGKLKAQPLQQFVVEKPTLNNGSDSAYKSRVTMIWEGTEWEKNPAVVTGLDYNPADLEGLIDVELEIVGTPSATEIQVQVNSLYTGDPVNFTVDDFVLTDASDGSTQTIASVTSEDGLHTLTGTALVSGSLNLVKPADLTTTGYESTGAVDVTIA